MATMMKKINFGCGTFKKKGYINVDINKAVNPDEVWDLEKFPYPFKDNEFDVVEAHHLLEHLKCPFKAMKEFHRICKNGGLIIISVPHFSRGFTHPDHKRGFDVSFPYYFNPSFKGGYIGVKLKLKKMRLVWFSQHDLKKNVLTKFTFSTACILAMFLNFFANASPFFCSRVWCYLVGGFDEIEFQFIKK